MVAPASLARLPYSFAREQGILLLATVDGKNSQILFRGDTDDRVPLAALSEVRRQFPDSGAPQRILAEEFDRQLSVLYAQGDDTAADLAADLGQDEDISRLLETLPPVEDLLESQNDAPIIRMINALLTQAARERVSDIHIEPYERQSIVRFRRDGLLRDVVRPNRALHAAMVSRIKIMASLDIAEKRLPQDGRMGIRIAGRGTDIRVSTIPVSHGERVVLRLLEKDAGRLDLNTLGMADDTLTRLDRLIHQPHGILLVTGPTGSGKTTTLYAALSRMDAQRLNIMTVEDPVEYELPGIGQIPVNAKIELDFARALRAILRQDPDVVMIGEIRDAETARIAVQASLTGHLVLATLHTNDAVSAVTRLGDMGIEPFLLSSSLLGVLAQRLVRRLCPDCRLREAVDPELGLPAAITHLYHPVGCPNCAQTGYTGRLGIYELLEINPELAAAIHHGNDEVHLRRSSQALGLLRDLQEDGLRWLAAGETSLEELLRVTGNS